MRALFGHGTTDPAVDAAVRRRILGEPRPENPSQSGAGRSVEPGPGHQPDTDNDFDLERGASAPVREPERGPTPPDLITEALRTVRLCLASSLATAPLHGAPARSLWQNDPLVRLTATLRLAWGGARRAFYASKRRLTAAALHVARWAARRGEQAPREMRVKPDDAGSGTQLGHSIASEGLAGLAADETASDGELNTSASNVPVSRDEEDRWQALCVHLGGQGIVVTKVARSGKGVAVTGTSDGAPVYRWYSQAELERFAGGAAKQHPSASSSDAAAPLATPSLQAPRELASSDPRTLRKRSLRPLLSLILPLVVVLAIAAWVAVRTAPPAAAELVVLGPAPVYSDYGEVLWIAAPGERYRVVTMDGDWVLGINDVVVGTSYVARVGWLIQGPDVHYDKDSESPAWRRAISGLQSLIPLGLSF